MVATATATPSPTAAAAPGVPPTGVHSLPGLSSVDNANLPCRTLYLRNICDKLKKPKLRELLHALCSPHGEVVWIVAEKTIRLRGQAFVTFKTQAGATAALRRLQGAQFLGRRLAAAYARAESDRAVPAGPLRGATRKTRKARPRPTPAPVPVEDAPAPQAPKSEEVPPVPVPTRVPFLENVPSGPV